MRFMAMASVSCASALMEPNDMAPVAKRFTISLAGSTSSSGIGRGIFFSSIKPRNVHSRLVLLVDQLRIFLERRVALLPDGVLQLADGERIQQMIFAVDAVLIIAADGELGFGFRDGRKAKLCLATASLRQHVQTDAFDARGRAGEIPIDQLFVQPMASKTCAPR